jgi:hypothetical protein
MKTVKKMLGTSLIFIGLVLLSIPAQAYTVVGAVPGEDKYIGSISEVATGPDMAGMQVTVAGSFAPQPVTGTWFTPFYVFPPFDGGAYFNGPGYAFYLFQGGDTYTNSWVMYSFYDMTLYGIKIDALPGNVVFDRTIDGVEKTPGSGLGKDFSTAYTSIPFPTRATYSNRVALDGKPFQGDLYTTLDIDFYLGAGVTIFDSQYYELFTADTDRITPVVPVPLATPLGSGLSFFATGLLGLIGLKRKLCG